MALRKCSHPTKALALALAVACLAGCATSHSPVTSTLRRDPAADLAQAVSQLAGHAEACHAAPPPGWNEVGLAALAEHTTAWATRLAEGGLAPVPGCVLTDFELQTQRVATLAARLGTTDTPDAEALVAMARALRVDLALARDPDQPLSAPEVAGVLTAADEALVDLTMAEDQARFLIEFMAANTEPDPEEGAGEAPTQRQILLTQAALHQGRAEALAEALRQAGLDDPRQVTYLINPEVALSPEAMAAEMARIELTLANHYAALPFSTGAEDLITWQILQAHAWGASLTAFPFVE